MRQNLKSRMKDNRFSIPPYNVYPLSGNALRLLAVLEVNGSVEMGLDEYIKVHREVRELVEARKVVRMVSENGVKVMLLEKG